MGADILLRDPSLNNKKALYRDERDSKWGPQALEQSVTWPLFVGGLGGEMLLTASCHAGQALSQKAALVVADAMSLM